VTFDVNTRDLSQFQTLVEIVAHLRSPQGCPWDREQHTTLCERICWKRPTRCWMRWTRRTPGNLCGELGDLLLQIVFHTQLATEAKEFTIADVVKGINSKLVYRHPHVFGTTKVKDSTEVLHNWDRLKKNERGTGVSPLASVPQQLPSLLYSQEVQRRAVQAGFNWDDRQGIVDKLAEEVKEFQNARTTGEKKRSLGTCYLLLRGWHTGRR